jgi:putative DNA primase/helicase
VDITLKQFLSAFFSPGDMVCPRVFADREEDKKIFKGQTYRKPLNEIDDIISALREHNKLNRGVFFTVNLGGHDDVSISRVNAHFVEMDKAPFDVQWERLNTFPLPPSVVVKTRKSLHAYWLMKSADLLKFRTVQRQLVKYFDGDPMCVNSSRVMRLPGFYHCKEEPIMVECVKFEPSLRYTQDELSALLPVVPLEAVSDGERSAFEGAVGDGGRVLEQCAFMR